MIAIARKHLSSLFSNPNSFLCISNNVPFSPPIHPFSTSRIKTLIIPSPEIFDVLANKHQFCPKLASLASSRLPQFRSPKIADLVLSFLKENSFTTPQLEKIVLYNPRILGLAIDGLQFKFKVFQDLGLSSEDIAKIMSSHQAILHSSLANKIIPSLSMLKGLMGSNEEVARLLRKSARFITSDLEKTLMPNVEIFKSHGVPVNLILGFIYSYSRFMLIKPDIMRKAVDRAIEFGISPTSLTFMHAAYVFGYTSEGMWEVKLQTLRDLEFSDDEIFTMFRKHPIVFVQSKEKIKSVIECILAPGKYNISDIVANPSSLGYSVEKRLEPQMQILGVLESMNLIENWPGLAVLSQCNNDRFFDSFILPYYAEIGEEQITKYVSRTKGKKRWSLTS